MTRSQSQAQLLLTKEQLDAQLDQYMSCTKAALDQELDNYMKNAMELEWSGLVQCGVCVRSKLWRWAVNVYYRLMWTASFWDTEIKV